MGGVLAVQRNVCEDPEKRAHSVACFASAPPAVTRARAIPDADAVTCTPHLRARIVMAPHARKLNLMQLVRGIWLLQQHMLSGPYLQGHPRLGEGNARPWAEWIGRAADNHIGVQARGMTSRVNAPGVTVDFEATSNGCSVPARSLARPLAFAWYVRSLRPRLCLILK